MNETDARAKSINPEDACHWHAEGTTWIGHRDDTGFAVALDDYVAAHLLTTEEIEAIPSATELLEEIRARTSISPMSPKDRLLVAHRDEYFAMFWKYAEEDEEDAPPAMQALIGGQGPVPATQEEADEVLAWCRGRIGCMPVPKRPSLPGDVQWPVEALRRLAERSHPGNRASREPGSD